MISTLQASIHVASLVAIPLALVIDDVDSHTTVKNHNSQQITRHHSAAVLTPAIKKLNEQANRLARALASFPLSSSLVLLGGHPMVPTPLPQYVATAHSER